MLNISNPVIQFISFSLECKIHFLSEQRTEPYIGYGEGVAQAKNGFVPRALCKVKLCLSLKGAVNNLCAGLSDISVSKIQPKILS